MKDKRIHIRLTEKENNKISSKAKKLNMTLTEYILYSAKNVRLTYYPVDEYCLEDIKKIGNEINELTKLANSGILKVVDFTDIAMELAKLNKKMHEITEKDFEV